MKEFEFRGVITNGVGKHVELHVPGKSEIEHSHAKWPGELHKGSLNVRISKDGYPDLFDELHLEKSTRSLDSKCIPATFEIGQAQFGNNQLRATAEMPHRGSAQVWQANLKTPEKNIACWVLRRYGSGLRDQLELVSDVHLRTKYQLENGTEVIVALQSIQKAT
jgi:hypothetical protein